MLLVIFADEIIWYFLVVFAFSSSPAQAAYRRAKRSIDRGFGALLGLFGLRLLANLRALLACGLGAAPARPPALGVDVVVVAADAVGQ